MRPPQRRPVRSLPGSSDRVSRDGWGYQELRRTAVWSPSRGRCGKRVCASRSSGWRSCARSRRATSTQTWRASTAGYGRGSPVALRGRCARHCGRGQAAMRRRRPPGRPPIGRPSAPQGPPTRLPAHREPEDHARGRRSPGVAPRGRSLGGDDRTSALAPRTWTPSRRSERVPVGGYCLATLFPLPSSSILGLPERHVILLSLPVTSISLTAPRSAELRFP